mmetsp:Transcript_37858/g.118620  ORF Transcript_37858/g.118620 Transcript_37858/m.118620 type:complete len:81 (-) Transcript_37858:248-490(-)
MAVEAPVFIIHGVDDPIVPFWHGQALLRAVSEPYRVKPMWVRGAGHNNIEVLLSLDRRLMPALREFFAKVRVRRLGVARD